MLLTLGLLSLMTARPVSHEETKKQDIILNDLFTVKDLNDLSKVALCSVGIELFL